MPKMPNIPPSLPHAIAVAAGLAICSSGVQAQSVDAPKAVEAPTAVAAETNWIGWRSRGVTTTTPSAAATPPRKARSAPSCSRAGPPLRPGEVLEFVPGLIVTQHSGDGKANQYFLRGFNLDHGTDFATFVDGMPVNMPTHGHGQGYTDLNFLIPELVAAHRLPQGAVLRERTATSPPPARPTSSTAPRFDAPFGLADAGRSAATARGRVGGSIDVGPGITLLGAVERSATTARGRCRRTCEAATACSRWSGGTEALGWSATAWATTRIGRSTDQIPQRLIDAGTFNGAPFGRFDSLDPTDGGDTRASSLSGEWHRRHRRTASRAWRPMRCATS